ncbi:MAG: hydroxyacylglutathione hydrolase [Rhodocyclaceae bacterium]|nr:hydroxyacylglutathione hydrolase [Rhodocyclaceae bacterium]
MQNASATPQPPAPPDGLTVEPIPAFEDNYLWLIHDGRDAVVVDPGDAAPVEATLGRLGLTLRAVLVTHSHADHIGGIGALLARRDIPVYGPAREPVPHRSHAVGDGSWVSLRAPALELAVLDVPGHTVGHVAYYGQNRLFCGDTLFACGCGRIDQPAAVMYASLMRLAALPPETLVYCTHEYTATNIRFALSIDPHNSALLERQERVTAMRAAGLPTLPSTIGEERSTNPFLRCEIDVLNNCSDSASMVKLDSSAILFAKLRKTKDSFR